MFQMGVSEETKRKGPAEPGLSQFKRNQRIT